MGNQDVAGMGHLPPRERNAPRRDTSLLLDISKMSDESIAFWLQRFVLEARRVNGEHYCPDSLYQLCCGLQRALRDADRDIIFLEQFTFSHFRSVLDGELKQLNTTGNEKH